MIFSSHHYGFFALWGKEFTESEQRKNNLSSNKQDNFSMTSKRLFFPFLLVVIAILHFFILQIFFPARRIKDKTVKKPEQTIKLKIVEEQQEEESKKAEPSKQSSAQSSSSLDFSKLNHQLTTNKPAQKRELPPLSETDGFGSGKGSCLATILNSVGKYPRSFFHRSIEGYAEVEIALTKRNSQSQISLRSIGTSHKMIERFFCYDLKKTFERFKTGECLKPLFEKKKKISYRLQYIVGQKVETNFLSLGKSRYLKKVVSLSKKSALRGLMAVANIFTLLDLRETEAEKREWVFYSETLERLDCGFITI